LGLLKAFVNRLHKGTIAMTAQLNEHENDPVYLSGRIMALLAAIQKTANPNIKASVVQRYYSSASTSPALRLGQLIRLANVAHLPTIAEKRPGLSVWFEKQLAEVWAKMQTPPKSVLSLKEQMLFAMGYYHQQARRTAAGDAPADDSSSADNA
jgi:CRISPR-associated protein Csd1